MKDCLNFYIDGKWVPPVTPKTLDVLDPATEEPIGRISLGSAADVDKAVAAARRAFETFGRSSREERIALLERIIAAYQARLGDLAETISHEMGAPMWLANAAQAPSGLAHLAQTLEVLKSYPFVENKGTTRIIKEPVGVCGFITPWNWPVNQIMCKTAPALAAGCTIVLKPSEIAPLSAIVVTEILHEAGVPAGVFNLVMGRGSVLGEALSRDPGVDAVSFTGSVAVGRTVAQNCAARLAKVQLEMGGKNPQIVLDDADLDTAVNVSLQSAFFSTGQRCTASSRLIVTEGIHDRFVSALTAKMKALKVDDALKEGTDIGPVVDERQLDQDLKYIELGKKEGAKLAQGGSRLEREKQGYYLEPALFVDTTPQMTINRDEIFGPVAAVIRVKNYDEALAVANDTPYGLSSGIATTSLKHAEHFKRNSAAGMVMVNLPTAGVDYHVPFGGRKGSSYGPREQGRYAVEFYTTVKTSYINP
jgi:aldehyde dehydrogenase (NAD+)